MSINNDNMVDRVARAICFECNDAFFDDLPERSTYIDSKTNVHRLLMDKSEARIVARSAIEAMREPTKDMLEYSGVIAGYDAEKDSPDADHTDWWNIMIDAALEDKKTSQEASS